jgi:hypothetical protein
VYMLFHCLLFTSDFKQLIFPVLTLPLDLQGA